MGAIVSCLSNLMYYSEKITLYLTCTGLIWCLMLTITITLGMGIGLGYNYCFVDMRTKYKYIKSHYIYPGSPRWPHRKRQGDALEEPAFDEAAADDALRKAPQGPGKRETSTAITDMVDLRALREYLRLNNTGNGTVMGYQPKFSDSESFNGTESSVETTVDEASDDEETENSEDSSETNSTTSFPTNSSTTEDVTETEILDETDEPTIRQPMVNEEKTKTSPSSGRVKKLVIPISGLDLISLLSKLKAENRNYSLQVVTT